MSPRLTFAAFALLLALPAFAQERQMPRPAPRDPAWRGAGNGPTVVIDGAQRRDRCGERREGSASAVMLDGEVFAQPPAPSEHCPAR